MINQHDIPVTEVDLGPGIRAFYTSRSGGCSVGAYEGLNVGDTVGDAADAVESNRDTLGAFTGASVNYLRQVHGNAVVDVTASDARDSRTPGAERQADGAVTSDPAVALCVYVADCVPVLLADPVARIIGSAHAGRPGLEARTISHTIELMVSQGADASRVRAAVGPCICPRCYEVPAEMALRFAQNTGTVVSQTQWDTPGIALRDAAHKELEAAGVAQVVHVDVCTYESGELYSHRWSTHHADETGGASGRFAGIVRLDVPKK